MKMVKIIGLTVGLTIGAIVIFSFWGITGVTIGCLPKTTEEKIIKRWRK